MDVNYKDLKSLFLCDPSIAIEYCQIIISTASNFNNFQEFFNYHINNPHISTCQNEWSNSQMSIHCVDCGLDTNSCVCLQCFLNGDHQGHNYFISPNSSGNCDCGDICLWKRSGFCSKHHGLDHDSHPENYLDEKLRTILTDVIFKASLSSILKLDPNDTTTLSQILQFLKSFLQFGDGFRRLLAISLTEKINFEKLMNHIFECSLNFNQQLQSFFGLLTSDEVFKNNFAQINYKLMVSRVIPISIGVVRGRNFETYRNIYPWESFWFHSYQVHQMEYNSKHINFDWLEFISLVLTYTKELFTFKGLRYIQEITPHIFHYIITFARFVQGKSSDEIQIVFDKFVTEILPKGSIKGLSQDENDTIITTSFNTELPNGYFIFIHSFNATFFDFIQSFKSDKNLKFEKLFDQLEKSIDITPIYLTGKNNVGSGNVNENERLIYRLFKQKNFVMSKINDNDYKSFINGGSFYVSNPPLYSLAYLLRSSEICRVKIAKLLSLEKYQGLRIQLGIATMKNLLSMVCYSQSLVQKSNSAANWLYTNYVDNPKLVSFGIPLFFPLMQLILGLKCNENKGINEFKFKEFFAFEMAREIGIFDDDKDDINVGNKKQMIFSFLYLSILFVIERKLFNFNGLEFTKEQIIFELKQGVSDLNQLNKLFDIVVNKETPKTTLMNKIIHEVATARQKSNKGNNENGNQDVSFHLKDGIEANFFSAINSFNREKAFMNSEISKHPDKLIQIQQFEPEETYFLHQNDESNELNVRLKEFFVTPTVLAIIYKTLRKSCESHSNELNDHLAMNILILVSKFVDDSNFRIDDSVKPKIKADKEIKYKSTIVDLIIQLNRSIFNYSISVTGGSIIQNTMTKEVFNLFLRMKIGSMVEEPKSIIDLLLEKGSLGKDALNQMGVEIGGDEDKKEKQDINQMKKNRARKVKEDILIHFNSLSSSFTLDDDTDDIQLTNTEKDVCSVCSMPISKDEILSYPLYIYRTKFPFIVDKPPVVEMTKYNEIREADVFQDEDILDPSYIDDDFDDDEKDEIPDPEMVLAQLLAQSPHLDLLSDLDDRELERRRNMIDMLHKDIMNKHERRVREEEVRKDQRRKTRQLEFLMKKDEILQKQKELEDPNSIVAKRCTAGNIFVIQFGICQHLVHPNCVHKEEFTCPIDRSFKNGFLPNIDDLTDDLIFEDISNKSYENLSSQLKESINVFIEKYSLFFRSSEEKIIDVFVELVKSISGLITTFEVRLRSLPDCLDSKKTKILSRNLFLTTWYAYRMKGKPVMKTGFSDAVSDDVDTKLTVFQRFIRKLIETDNIEEDEVFNQLVSSFVRSSFVCSDIKKEKEMCLFLRRVCLAEHFLLKEKTGNIELKSTKEIIVWDDILSSDSLSQKFNVSFDHLKESKKEFEFRPFIFSKIPKEFVRLAAEPFNFPVEQTGQLTIFNLLDYNELIRSYDDLADEGEDDDGNKIDFFSELTVIQDQRRMNEILMKMFARKNYPSIVLFIGSKASTVYAIDGKRMRVMRPFYLDKYGCTDIGFKRSQPLFLSEERYERFMDQILSGDFSSNLQPFPQ